MQTGALQEVPETLSIARCLHRSLQQHCMLSPRRQLRSMAGLGRTRLSCQPPVSSLGLRSARKALERSQRRLLYSVQPSASFTKFLQKPKGLRPVLPFGTGADTCAVRDKISQNRTLRRLAQHEECLSPPAGHGPRTDTLTWPDMAWTKPPSSTTCA